MQVTFTVSETKKVVKSAGDTASWYYEVEIPAGTYEASCQLIGGKACSLEEAYWVVVKIPGTCVGGWLPGYRGSNDAERDFGKPMDYFIQVYGYQVRNSLEQDSPTPWALSETVPVGQ
jgi:hypothetical protein